MPRQSSRRSTGAARPPYRDMISDDQDVWTEEGERAHIFGNSRMGGVQQLPVGDAISDAAHFYHNHRIGKERRRFLIVVAFDFVLVLLLWIVHTAAEAGTFESAFKKETNLTNAEFFEQSLFDVTLLSLVRSFWLIVCYAAVRANHWAPVAVSTALTTVFLLVKSLFFFRGNFQHSNVAGYSLVLAAFIMCWVELWLIPFGVLRKERRRQEDQEALVVNAVPAATTDDDFRSAMEFSSGSSDEEGPDGGRKRAKIPTTVYRPFSNEDYIRAGKESLEIGKQWYEMVDQWTQSSKNPVVRWTHDKQYGRTYYLKDELPVPVSALYHCLYTMADQQNKWNKQCQETKCLLRINEFTDVIYSVSAPALRGYISSREFLDVRYYELDVDRKRYLLTNMSVASTIVPVAANKKLVRGENGPNLWVLQPSQTNPNHSSFEWIMNTNLKGDIPKRLVERSLTSFLINFTKALKTQLISVQESNP